MCMLDTWVKPDGTRKRSEGLFYAKIVQTKALSKGTKCRPHGVMFVSPLEVGLKTSCLPYANILNLHTEEEIAAIPISVEESGENVGYVDGTNTEINEDIYTTQGLGKITVIINLQQEV